MVGIPVGDVAMPIGMVAGDGLVRSARVAPIRQVSLTLSLPRALLGVILVHRLSPFAVRERALRPIRHAIVGIMEVRERIPAPAPTLPRATLHPHTQLPH